MKCPKCKTRDVLQGNGTPDLCAECLLTFALCKVLSVFADRIEYDEVGYAMDVIDVLGIDVPAWLAWGNE